MSLDGPDGLAALQPARGPYDLIVAEEHYSKVGRPADVGRIGVVPDELEAEPDA